MTLAVELGVYATVLVISLFAAVMIYVANRRFLEGELKRLMNWFVSAAACIFFGALFTVIYTITTGTIYAGTMLIAAGLAFILSALFFIRAAYLLHDFSKTFGFASVEKDFDKLIAEIGKSKKRAKNKPAKKKR